MIVYHLSTLNNLSLLLVHRSGVVLGLTMVTILNILILMYITGQPGGLEVKHSSFFVEVPFFIWLLFCLSVLFEMNSRSKLESSPSH